MSALEQLKEKIKNLKVSYQSLQEENKILMEELDGATAVDGSELDKLKKALKTKENEIKILKEELAEKDTEIEAIIAKVEALLA